MARRLLYETRIVALSALHFPGLRACTRCMLESSSCTLRHSASGSPPAPNVQGSAKYSLPKNHCGNHRTASAWTLCPACTNVVVYANISSLAFFRRWSSLRMRIVFSWSIGSAMMAQAVRRSIRPSNSICWAYSRAAPHQILSSPQSVPSSAITSQKGRPVYDRACWMRKPSEVTTSSLPTDGTALSWRMSHRKNLASSTGACCSMKRHVPASAGPIQASGVRRGRQR
mmetsp:Transcript_23721/g.60656  ORF Transcript_23721/g.60656 Transcript_23721/m.60656 type:complete len:228 (+) Transcript_23721:583-1266(+)